jgi:hypothetical protein
MFISRSLVEYVKGCGIPPFDLMFSIDHIPLYVNFDISALFGHTASGTQKSALRDLKLDNPHLIDAYESALCKKLYNHNIELRVSKLFAAATDMWKNNNEFQFNQAERDITGAMEFAVNT